MIEIETKNWPYTLVYDVIYWCLSSFGPPQEENWFFNDDYTLWFSEKNLVVFTLKYF